MENNFNVFKADLYDYTELTNLADKHGYTYEPFTVRTVDAWHLSIFYISGYKG